MVLRLQYQIMLFPAHHHFIHPTPRCSRKKGGGKSKKSAKPAWMLDEMYALHESGEVPEFQAATPRTKGSKGRRQAV
jgi:hypothetical protein